MQIDKTLLDVLRCPRSGQPLHIKGDGLVTADGSMNYAVKNGVPILILDSAESAHAGWVDLPADNRKTMHFRDYGEADAARFLDGMLVHTCGNLYHGVHLLEDYPIPDFPEFPKDSFILDLGCNWGRWSIAGAKAGYRIVGVDVHLEALLCARWLSQKLVPGNEPYFVLADARSLPFASDSFDGAFSYGVIQHFSRNNATIILDEISRVMKRGARSVVQMPNKAGLATLLTKRRIRNSDGSGFDVRYYSLGDLLTMFERKIGKSDWYVDCFLGLNVHSKDRRLLPTSKQWIVNVAELLYRTSQVLPAFGKLADSVLISSTKK